MRAIRFDKLQASGNDFILIDNLNSRLKGPASFYKNFAKKHCDRKLGVGADGMLLIEPSSKALFKMRIFNSDGSEAEMCGNGARCSALWMKTKAKNKKSAEIAFETKAGIIKSEVNGKSNVRIKTTNPFDKKLDIPVTVLGKKIKVNFINTGVPHAVIFVEGLKAIDVEKIGRAVRFHKIFSPAGANVNFVEVLDKDFIKVRTYERGVEAETLACGTGVVASAIITGYKLSPKIENEFKVLAKSGEILKVCFNSCGGEISDVWLTGKANFVYKGEISY